MKFKVGDEVRTKRLVRDIPIGSRGLIRLVSKRSLMDYPFTVEFSNGILSFKAEELELIIDIEGFEL